MRESPHIFWTSVAVVCLLSGTLPSHAQDASGAAQKASRQPADKSPSERIAMAFDGVSDSPKKFVIGDDGVAVKADEAAPAAIVGSRESKLQRPDIINTSTAIEASEEAIAHKEVGLSADPRMAQVERFSTTQIEKMIADVAITEGVDPKFALAIAKVESRFNQFAQSEDGAMGVMQLMPETAADLGVENPWDAAQNIKGGIKYLKALTAEFQHPLLVAAAYHSGPQAVHDTQGIPKGPRTAGYMVALLNGFYDIYGSSGAAARAPVSKKNRGSSTETAALSRASEQSPEETPASNGIGKWEQGFVLHLD